ncbi:MAG: hypothetical protein H7Y07_05910 [Pyrinomonadaceae bacterium]|nr:hypothetical protein [Sphingobacteriaceae bacterium]
MKNTKHYNSLDEVLHYFLSFLPDANADCISSVIKYAKVNNEDVKLAAIKRKISSGFTWNFEITLGQS